MQRIATLDHTRADKAARTVPAVISTADPVQMGDYLEVLDHSARAVLSCECSCRMVANTVCSGSIASQSGESQRNTDGSSLRTNAPSQPCLSNRRSYTFICVFCATHSS